MSITNKKIDALRRLLLGPLYDQCKENPMGVKRDVLEAHLKKIQREGCIGECTLDEFVKTCQLSSHYPTCASSGEYRGCVEGIGEKSKGVEKVYYDQYKRAKSIEDEPDEEEEEEGEMCNACYLSGPIDGKPVEQMSCGHYSHKSCLITQAQSKGEDNAICPECRKVFSLEEVPVPTRTLQQRQEDSARRADFNRTQMGFEPLGLLRRRPNITEEEEEDENETFIDGIARNIRNNNIEESITGIRSFYTRQFSTRTIFSNYVKYIYNAIIDQIEIQDISMDNLRRLLEVILSHQRFTFILNNINIRNLERSLRRATQLQREQTFYLVKRFTRYYAVDRSQEEFLDIYAEYIIGNNCIKLLEKVFEEIDEINAQEVLRNSINEVIDIIDLDRLEDRTKEMIEEWFTRNNFQPPSFSSENVAESMTESIINYITEHYIDEAVEIIQEFYQREFEEIEWYSQNWFTALLTEISIGQIETEDVERIVDTIVVESEVISLSRDVLRMIKRIISNDNNDQKEQALYIFTKVIKELIINHPEDEKFGLLIDDLITSRNYILFKEMLKIVDDNNKIDLFKRKIITIINFSGIIDSSIRDMLSEWFISHNLEVPSFEPEQYSGESEDED